MKYCVDDFDLMQAEELEYEESFEDYEDYPRRASGHFSYDFSSDLDFIEKYRLSFDGREK